MVAPVIKGIQSKGVIANAKHFVMNSQESNRHNVVEEVDERTMFEIYYPPFKAAVDAGVGSVMCSYNKIDTKTSTGTDLWACENPDTLNRDLKGRMGFNGWVMSDWGATHSTSIMAGLDQEMPTNLYMGPALEKAVQAGTIPMSAVDDSVLRMLTPMFQMGLFDTPSTGDVSRNVTSVAHNQLARTLAAASTVLLKNEGGVLPLSPKGIGGSSSGSNGGVGNDGDSESIVRSLSSVRTIGTIAVLGVAASDAPIVHGNGSGHVDPPYVITGLQGIAARAGAGVNVVYNNGTSPLLSRTTALATLFQVVGSTTFSSAHYRTRY
jgi:beta-glucosidase